MLARGPINGSAGGGARRGAAAQLLHGHDYGAAAYAIIFATAFLSALCGFNTGATLAVHHGLHGGGLLGALRRRARVPYRSAPLGSHAPSAAACSLGEHARGAHVAGMLSLLLACSLRAARCGQ